MAPAKKLPKNRRRFNEEGRKVWTEEERAGFLRQAEKIAPYVRHLTTPAPKDKEPVPWYKRDLLVPDDEEEVTQ